MKCQKINDDQWRITAPDGSFANLDYCGGKWHVTIHPNSGPDFLGGSHIKRFDAKVEAEQLLSR